MASKPPDDFFDDDIAFDDLPPNTLETLEQHARLSAASQRPSNPHPAAHPVFVAPKQSAPSTQPKSNRPPSSDYGFDDEDVIDLDAQPIPATADALNPSSNLLTRVPSHNLHSWKPAKSQHQHALSNNPITKADTAESISPAADQEELVHMNVDALKARILKLEQAHTDLQKAADDSKAAALAKAGEISIVRANHDRATRDYEARIATLQRLHLDDVAKARAELDAARREREKVETSNKFLEHDLAQETQRARTLKKSLRDGRANAAQTTGQQSPFSTPRKNKGLAFRDGFEDDEVLFVSPTKIRDRSKPSTPRAGTKRKRPTADKAQNDSPRLSFLEDPPADDAPAIVQDDTPKPPASLSHRETDRSREKFDLMQQVLNHRSDPDRDRSLEILTKFALPSNPVRRLSSIIYDDLAPKPLDQDVERYRQELCGSIMSLWSQCLNEQYHAPLYDLSELLQYILMISPSSLSTTLSSRLVPLCQSTADLQAVPVAKSSKPNSASQPQSMSLQGLIDPLDYLNTLHLIAMNCETPADLHAFWSAMEFDFVLVMLHKAQPIDQMIEMLELLFTSILDDTFGAIATVPEPSQGASTDAEATAASTTTSRPAKQQKMENDILDRLTVLLFEIPQQQHPSPQEPRSISISNDGHSEPPDEPPTPHTPASLLPLRTTVLTLLYTLAHTPHGAAALSAHRLAIPRLARFLHESLLQLYAYFPTTAHAATAACVNTTVLLLAHLDASPSAVVRTKLAAVPGGLQRWLVCLSRVAFAEGVGAIEAGLLPEVREVAHRVLDEMLSPEEGEGVLGVFL